MYIMNWLIVVYWILPQAAVSFVAVAPLSVTSVHQRTRHCHCHKSRRSDEMDEEQELAQEAKRMELVRSLQSAFYRSSAETNAATFLDDTSGILHHLPLWRVQWTELPGRSNVLNVHEGTYTNMFETILTGDRPWYFGHLYLPEGSTNLKSNDYCHKLKPYSEELRDTARASEPSRSAVVGTLMRIVDYRRLKDGRLILLVQAMERFVVSNVVQMLPYSVANVQLLPDLDSYPHATEEQAKGPRTKLIVRSMQYQEYEFEDTRLPLADSQYLDKTDVYGVALRDIIPFVPLADDESSLAKILDLEPLDSSPTVGLLGLTLSLEARLLNGNILCEPPWDMDDANDDKDRSLDELERRLWRAIEDFCASRQARPADGLLQLRPPGLLTPTFPETRRPSPRYPALRRQRRLSFAAPALLEGKGDDLRPLWLEISTTRARLRAVLEFFDMANQMTMGEFQ